VSSAMNRLVCQKDPKIDQCRRHLLHSLSEKRSTGNGNKMFLTNSFPFGEGGLEPRAAVLMRARLRTWMRYTSPPGAKVVGYGYVMARWTTRL
jgi:hypothetical protein